MKIDLHMHTTVSDGTDSPEEIITKVREAGIDLFSVTDHDAIKGCSTVRENLKEGDPAFINGIEFSCKDEFGKYHILGYGYDLNAPEINSIVQQGHAARIEKLQLRIDALKSMFGIVFDEEDIKNLFALNNPGKPHLAKLLVKYGFAETITGGFEKYLNHLRIKSIHFLPEEAISAILSSGGIPILAHPSYGSGDELIIGKEMEERLQRLLGIGIRGLEGFYSGFSPKLQSEILALAEKYDLFVTAGSDYHGSNKIIHLGDNHLSDTAEAPEGLRRFLEKMGN